VVLPAAAPPVALGGMHPLGAPIPFPLNAPDAKAVKNAISAAALPPMGAPVPLEYVLHGLIDQVPAPGGLAQWCADAIQGPAAAPPVFVNAVSPGTIWNTLQVLRRILGLPLACGGRFAGRGGVWWKGGRPKGGAPKFAVGGMLTKESGKVDFGLFADGAPRGVPAGGAADSDDGAADSGDTQGTWMGLGLWGCVGFV
jgi:hypothetical protein